MKKYPSTIHIETSGIQKGDSTIRFSTDKLLNNYLVIEEKLDGANSGISFVEKELKLQSRGHYLVGHPREAHFSLFKQWANYWLRDLYSILGNRYIMYGEWLYAKHTIFYNNLSHYFYEFDIYDKEQQIFLSTERRQSLLLGSSIQSVLILGKGKFNSLDELLELHKIVYTLVSLQSERILM